MLRKRTNKPQIRNLHAQITRNRYITTLCYACVHYKNNRTSTETIDNRFASIARKVIVSRIVFE